LDKGIDDTLVSKMSPDVRGAQNPEVYQYQSPMDGTWKPEHCCLVGSEAL